MKRTVFFLMIIFSLISILGTYKINRQINKVFSSINENFIIDDIQDVDDSGNFSKNINKTSLEKDIKEYLNINLIGFIKSYEVSFIYFKNNGDNLYIDLSNNPKNVQIHFRYNIFVFFNIDKYKTFKIEEISW